MQRWLQATAASSVRVFSDNKADLYLVLRHDDDDDEYVKEYIFRSHYQQEDLRNRHRSVAAVVKAAGHTW